MTSFKLKVVLRGNFFVGKSSIIEKIVENRFEANYRLTVGVDILTKHVELIYGETATLCIWDIDEEHRFDFIRHLFYDGAAGAILIFDLSQEGMFTKAVKWFSEITKSVGFIPFILIGNNVQLIKKKNSTNIREKAREFVRNKGGIYIETSPTSIEIVKDALRELTRRIIQLRLTN